MTSTLPRVFGVVSITSLLYTCSSPMISLSLNWVCNRKMERVGLGGASGCFSIISFICQFGYGAKYKTQLVLILYAVVWVLWEERNNYIFAGTPVDNSRVLDRIKVLSRRWFIARSGVGSYHYYEWWAAVFFVYFSIVVYVFFMFMHMFLSYPS